MEKKELLCFIIKNIFFLFFILLFNISIVNANYSIQDKTDYTNIDNIIKQYNNLKENNFKLENKEKLYIFMSFSMPDNMIKNYFSESQNLLNKDRNTDIVFVLRGFYKNSFKETRAKIATLTQNNNNKPLGIIVDPILFQKYNIQQVPIIIKEYKNGNYDIIKGSITIKYALETFKKEENNE